MIKACIFDLDGTLANTLDSMAYVANEILRGMGLKEQPTENFKYYSGEGDSMTRLSSSVPILTLSFFEPDTSTRILSPSQL